MGDAPILLVEDNPDDEFLSRRALKKNGIDSVAVAHDGEEALAYLFGSGTDAQSGAQPIPPIILLDLKLPKVDGIEFLQAVRANARTREIPVIVISSSQEETDVERCNRLGIRFFLTKPLNRLEIAEALKALGILHQT